MRVKGKVVVTGVVNREIPANEGILKKYGASLRYEELTSVNPSHVHTLVTLDGSEIVGAGVDKEQSLERLKINLRNHLRMVNNRSRLVR